MREELLPWRKPSYCRIFCHDLYMFRYLVPIPNKTHSLSAPISLKNHYYDYVSVVRNNQYALNATSLSYRTPRGCMALADIQSHQRLAHDSPMHFHPELILQHVLHRRRYEQCLLTDNGTGPPCYRVLLIAVPISRKCPIPIMSHPLSDSCSPPLSGRCF